MHVRARTWMHVNHGQCKIRLRRTGCMLPWQVHGPNMCAHGYAVCGKHARIGRFLGASPVHAHTDLPRNLGVDEVLVLGALDAVHR